MRPPRLLLAALLIAGLSLGLWTILTPVTRSTSESSNQQAGEDDAGSALRGPRLGGGAETPRAPAGERARTEATEPTDPRRSRRRTARRKAARALDVRIVTPVGHAPPETLRMAVVEGGSWIHADEIHPDADGWARVPLPPRRGDGTATLILDADGFAWSVLREVRLVIRGVQYRGDVLLDPGRTITGRVLDDEGDGVWGADVTAFPQGIPPGRIGFRYPKPREGESARDGSFEIRHAPLGPVVLRVRHVSYVARPRTVPVHVESVRLSASHAGHIWGTIGREGGGGAMVMLRAEPLDPTWAEPLVDGSDHYGRIRMGPLLPGRYRIVMEMGHTPGEPAGPHSPPIPPEPIPDVEMGIVTVEAGEHALVRWTVP